LTRGALAEMRTLLLELRPAALTEKPLGELIRNLTDATSSRTRVPITLEVENDALLAPNIQIAFYRIAQEALNNIAKHAEATHATVRLNASAQGVVLEVRDDGSGFDPLTIPAGHLGIAIMRERIQSIGGQIQIESLSGAGTQITVVWHSSGGSMPNGPN
jgi:signal transduction histidine kinase